MDSSSAPVHIADEDNDEFDWEAAVREIDEACHATNTNNTSTSLSNLNTSRSTANFSAQNAHKNNSKQSTLDKFIGIRPKEAENLKLQPESSKCLGNNNYEINKNNKVNNYRDDAFEGDDETIGCMEIDAEAAKTWIYPENLPVRDYQFYITQTALFSNTLVALPTGLGKTFIAAVVMYNYFRWFPEGKIVFAAPSRPLVMQQIEACHNIAGIPQEWTIDLTGQTSPTKRAVLWKDKRVFFVTPQVLEKDIHSGSCLVKQIVCLVIDEAHRATGNYSYCVVVRELMAVPVQLRILALTATPGSKQQTVQNIIDNLQISTLEFRNESDSDVVPYVHERKKELIQVAMGKEDLEINNLLLEAARPLVDRLCGMGVLHSRDLQMLSPHTLLNAREKFRLAPPQDLPDVRFGEAEGYFGVLITLYHLRKLLSGHGIRPSLDMLEEKLQKGFFARLMSRNEAVLRAKLIMQQSVTHGAPSPKLSKMLEVLVDHFKTNDPQNSRVIIFSSFRGSVRDIMNALTSIGQFVKATEFVGQSSGKTLKGQSQKVQQAVLEKFRAGGYNVIVATSIGEEGLDITEVDLVICFDANISPLRMTQRMGRTGRKHEGRVVVLACEGLELKGYMRKQANSKTIMKHLRNGGKNSFNFHSSPRMIPHIFKPEVQFVKVSVETFVPRGKKVKDDHPIEKPTALAKLTDAETKLIAKYIGCTQLQAWKPSLIAFPHFQAFPSRVHKVMHSFRTRILIDAMQELQGFTASRDSKNFLSEEAALSNPCIRVEAAIDYDTSVDVDIVSGGSKGFKGSSEKAFEADTEPKEISGTETSPCLQDFQNQRRKPPVHCFLFSSEFITVDDLGKVVISLPVLPSAEVSNLKCSVASGLALSQKSGQNCPHPEPSTEDYKEKIARGSVCFSQATSADVDNLQTCGLNNHYTLQEEHLAFDERMVQSPVPIWKSNREDKISESPEVPKSRVSMLSANESDGECADLELSPRLTNFIKSGVVPESPADDAGVKGLKGEIIVLDDDSSPSTNSKVFLSSAQPSRRNHDFANGAMDLGSVQKFQSCTVGEETDGKRACKSGSTFEETRISSGTISDPSCSKDWIINSEENSQNEEQQCRFRRLRKHGYLNKKGPPKNKSQNIVHSGVSITSGAGTSNILANHVRGQENQSHDVTRFIQEEAEVSSEVTVSDDEEDEQENTSYDDSFIDDRINTTASTEVEAGRLDMMAIYRRSLLSQSPVRRLPSHVSDFSPDSVIQSIARGRRLENTSSPGIADHSLQTPQTCTEATTKDAESCQSGSDTISKTIASTSSFPKENESRNDSRKRKLSFYQEGSLPIQNLEEEFLFHSGAAGKQSPNHVPLERIEEEGNMLDDDQFYQEIDLDAVEEAAAKQLRQKSECPSLNRVMVQESVPPAVNVLGSPSFDLGF